MSDGDWPELEEAAHVIAVMFDHYANKGKLLKLAADELEKADQKQFAKLLRLMRLIWDSPERDF